MRRCLDRNPKTRITIPELLDHAFLHPGRQQPNAAPAITADQLRLLLLQFGVAGDVDQVVEGVLAQLATGGQLDIPSIVQQARARNGPS